MNAKTKGGQTPKIGQKEGQTLNESNGNHNRIVRDNRKGSVV